MEHPMGSKERCRQAKKAEKKKQKQERTRIRALLAEKETSRKPLRNELTGEKQHPRQEELERTATSEPADQELKKKKKKTLEANDEQPPRREAMAVQELIVSAKPEDDDQSNQRKSKLKRKNKDLLDTATNPSLTLEQEHPPQSKRQKLQHTPITITTEPQGTSRDHNGTATHSVQMDHSATTTHTSIQSTNVSEKPQHKKSKHKNRVKDESKPTKRNNNEDREHRLVETQTCIINDLEINLASSGAAENSSLTGLLGDGPPATARRVSVSQSPTQPSAGSTMEPVKKKNKKKKTIPILNINTLQKDCATDMNPQNNHNPLNVPPSTDQAEERERDSELDRILVDSDNRHILDSKSNLPDSFKSKLPSLTCREILTSLWLDITHLNELSTLFGLKYKKGKFTQTEQTAIESEVTKFCSAHGVKRADFGKLLVRKKKDKLDDDGTKLRGLAPTISQVLPGRPIISIWKYIRRAYDPRGKLGRWTPEEEAALQEAHNKHGSSWTLISEKVGRSADDCRDRWKNYTSVKGLRNDGKWSKEEEEKLTQLMTQSNPQDLKDDRFYTWVSNQMGGSRSRAQCRVKWVECLQPKLESGSGRRRWLNRDIITLAQQLKKYNLGDDEVGFNWKQVKAGVDGWEGWDHYYLQRRWKSLRQYMRKKHQKNWGKNRGSEGASGPPPLSNHQIIHDALTKWSATDPAQLDLPVESKSGTKKPTSEAKNPKPDAKQSKSDAKNSESDAKKPKSDAKKPKSHAKKLKSDAKKLKSDAKKSDSDPQKSLSEATESEAKKLKSDAKKRKSDAQETKSDAKRPKSDAKKLKSDAKKTDYDPQKSQFEATESEAKKLKSDAKKPKSNAKKPKSDAKKSDSDAQSSQFEATESEAKK